MTIILSIFTGLFLYGIGMQLFAVLAIKNKIWLYDETPYYWAWAWPIVGPVFLSFLVLSRVINKQFIKFLKTHEFVHVSDDGIRWYVQKIDKIIEGREYPFIAKNDRFKYCYEYMVFTKQNIPQRFTESFIECEE